MQTPSGPNVNAFFCPARKRMGFPGGLAVKKPPAMQEMQETWVRSLGREDPLEEGTAAHSSNFVWTILRTEEPGRLSSVGSQKSQT